MRLKLHMQYVRKIVCQEPGTINYRFKYKAAMRGR